jgi:hypothetical protein
LTGILSQLKSGRTSAPRLPHAWQMNLGSRSDSLKPAGHRSAFTALRDVTESGKRRPRDGAQDRTWLMRGASVPFHVHTSITIHSNPQPACFGPRRRWVQDRRMQPAMRSIVDIYVRRGNRKALNDLKASRERLIVGLRRSAALTIRARWSLNSKAISLSSRRGLRS